MKKQKYSNDALMKGFTKSGKQRPYMERDGVKLVQGVFEGLRFICAVYENEG